MPTHLAFRISVALAVLASSCTRGPEDASDGLWSRLTERASDAVAEAPRVLVQKAIDETEGLLETLNRDYAPVLLEAGFEISQVRISLGVPPGLAFRVKQLEAIDASRQEELLERHRDDETLAAILQALFAMQRFDAEGFELQEIVVYSELPPRVTLILEPESVPAPE